MAVPVPLSSRRLRLRSCDKDGVPHRLARVRSTYSDSIEQRLVVDEPALFQLRYSVRLPCAVSGGGRNSILSCEQLDDGNLRLAVWHPRAVASGGHFGVVELSSNQAEPESVGYQLMCADYVPQLPSTLGMTDGGTYQAAWHAMASPCTWVVSSFDSLGRMRHASITPWYKLFEEAGLDLRTLQFRNFVDDLGMPTVFAFWRDSLAQTGADDNAAALVRTQWKASQNGYVSSLVRVPPPADPAGSKRRHRSPVPHAELYDVNTVALARGLPGRNELYVLEQWRYGNVESGQEAPRRHQLSVRSSLTGELLRHSMVQLPHLHVGTTVDALLVGRLNVVTAVLSWPVYSELGSARRISQWTLSSDRSTVVWRTLLDCSVLERRWLLDNQSGELLCLTAQADRVCLEEVV